MGKLRSYILSNLSLLFYSIFISLFAIASVVFMIKLANYTKIIQLSVAEMGELYLFILPDLFFYTLPVAFVVSAALTLYRLSNDNETVVVFSLGISPSYLAKILAVPAMLLTLLLYVDFLAVSPYIKIISNNFLNQKKAEAKFNLTASEFGHHFGDWMLFINSTDPRTNTFNDIILFNKNIKDEILISAKSAALINQKGVLQLRLNDGESFSYNQEKLRQMTFKTAYINDMLSNEPVLYRSIFDFWTDRGSLNKRSRDFVRHSLLSLFPILSLWLILALGIVHARHQKRWIYLWLFVAILLYYTLSIVPEQWLGFHSLWVIPSLWLGGTYLLYRRIVGQRF